MDEQEIKMRSAAEQVETGVEQVAIVIAAYYHALIANGIDKQFARQLVIAYQTSFFGAVKSNDNVR